MIGAEERAAQTDAIGHEVGRLLGGAGYERGGNQGTCALIARGIHRGDGGSVDTVGNGPHREAGGCHARGRVVADAETPASVVGGHQNGAHLRVGLTAAGPGALLLQVRVHPARAVVHRHGARRQQGLRDQGLEGGRGLVGVAGVQLAALHIGARLAVDHIATLAVGQARAVGVPVVLAIGQRLDHHTRHIDVHGQREGLEARHLGRVPIGARRNNMAEQHAEQARELGSGLGGAHVLAAGGRGDALGFQVLGNARGRVGAAADMPDVLLAIGRQLGTHRHIEEAPAEVARGVAHLELDGHDRIFIQRRLARFQIEPVRDVGDGLGNGGRRPLFRRGVGHFPGQFGIGAAVHADVDARQVEAAGQLVGQGHAVAGGVLLIFAVQGHVAGVLDVLDAVGEHPAHGRFHVGGLLHLGIGVDGHLADRGAVAGRREVRLVGVLAGEGLHPLVVERLAVLVVAAVAEVGGGQHLPLGIGVLAGGLAVIGGVGQRDDQHQLVRLAGNDLLALLVGGRGTVGLLNLLDSRGVVRDQVLAVGHVLLSVVQGDLTRATAGAVGQRRQTQIVGVGEVVYVQRGNLVIAQGGHVVNEDTARLGLADVLGLRIADVHVGVHLVGFGILDVLAGGLVVFQGKGVVRAQAGRRAVGRVEAEHVVHEVDLGLASFRDVLHCHLPHGIVVVVP